MEIKEAVEELKLYKKSLRRQSYIKAQMARLRDRMSSLGGGGENLGIEGGKTNKDEKLLNFLDKLQQLTNDLSDMELFGYCVQSDIERKIYKLREPYCSVLRGFFVQGKSLEKIAVELNYTFDGVKSIKNRGIKEYAQLPPIFLEIS